MNDVLSEEGLLTHFAHLHDAVLPDDNDVIDVAALSDQFAFAPLQSIADKSFLLLCVELDICYCNCRTRNGFKRPQFRLPLAACAVLLFEHSEPLDGVIREVVQVVLDLIDVPFQPFNQAVGFEAIKLGNALDADFRQPRHILIGDRAQQVLGVRLESFVDGGQDILPRLALLDVPVDPVLNKYFLQGREVPLLLQFTQFNLQLQLEQPLRPFGRNLEQLLDPEELRLVIENDGGVG